MKRGHLTLIAVEAEVREVGPVTVADIVAETGLSESAVRRALEKLEVRGRVESDSYQRRAQVWMAIEGDN